MNTLQHIGLTRESVARLASRFSTPRIDVANPKCPAGKRTDELKSSILELLRSGRRNTPYLQIACGVGKETLRLTLRHMEESGLVRRFVKGKGGKRPVQAVWEVVR